MSRTDLPTINLVARWLAATGALGRRTAALVGGPVHARSIAPPLGDPNAARCELRVGGESFELSAASAGVRRIAQRVLGGPTEIAAPRPLNAVESAIWALVVAAALEDLGIAGEVWPCESPLAIADDNGNVIGSLIGSVIELAVELDAAGTPWTVALRAPRSLAMRARPLAVPAWADRVRVASEVVLGRCLIDRAALAGLAPRKIVTLDRASDLVVLGGSLGLVIRPGEVVAEVATHYSGPSMSLPDEARVELTVGLATAQLPLRQVLELAVGQVVPLGRPIAGPFEIRAAGALVGRGELVDLDGELGVRIVSVEQE
ncbi:MAG TPA: FliM/FliN family flagellar motor switch protein [Kofleriaceae bacterium]